MGAPVSHPKMTLISRLVACTALLGTVSMADINFTEENTRRRLMTKPVTEPTGESTEENSRRRLKFTELENRRLAETFTEENSRRRLKFTELDTRRRLSKAEANQS